MVADVGDERAHEVEVARHRATLESERKFWRPSSVKIDSEDRIFVADTNRHRIQVYRKESVAVDAEWIDLDNPKRELQER